MARTKKKSGVRSQESEKQTPAVPEQGKSSIINNQSSIERWSFPSVSACPRCRGTNTQATSTQGRVQYRVCRSAVCRQRYHVLGTKIKS